jgi:uncharacterized damage-inducible protein DinB
MEATESDRGLGTRASDWERDAVVQRVQEAFAEGRLNDTEFDERMRAALTARTRADLDVLLTDLPAAAEAPGTAPAVPGRGPGRFAIALKGSVRRAGRWRVPERYTTVVYKGGGWLDLRAAELSGPVTTFLAVASKSRVTIVVPPNVWVEMTGFGVTQGAADEEDPGYRPMLRSSTSAAWRTRARLRSPPVRPPRRHGMMGAVTWKAPDVERPEGPLTGAERPMLQAFLDWQRATLLYKCAGLTGEQLAERSVPPSGLSLLGLVRHMTEVERVWFRQRFAGEPVEHPFGGDKTADFERVDPARAASDYARLTEEFKLADAAVANASLDDTFTHRNELMSLRMIYLHMIEEYARHLGHADLLRERIDGATGE